MGMQSGIATLEDRLEFSYETKHTTTYNPAIALLDMHSNEVKTLCPHKTVLTMLIAALLI